MRYSVSYMYSDKDKTTSYVIAHSFAIAEDGVLLFYNELGKKVSAYRQWFVVEENP